MPTVSALPATLIAFLMVAGQQFVLAAGWCIAAALMRSVRIPALYWAGFAALTGVSLLLFVASVLLSDIQVRAAGNVAALVSLIALQRGVRRFFGVGSGWRVQLAALLIGIGVSALVVAPELGAWRIGIVSALVGGFFAGIARDVVRLAGHRIHPRWGWALAAPLGVGALVFLARALDAAIRPERMVAEVVANNSLNVGAAFTYLVLMLVFQLTLVSLVVSRLVGELRRMARRDPLTGLLNRRAIDEALADEAQRARRLASPFAVLMMDVDHFKSVNDEQGHAAGDRALQHLATLLSTQMRDIDRLGRYGGEEFLVLLPATSGEDSAVMAERLRERVASMPMSWEDAMLRLTISVGVAPWRGDVDDVSAMLARADDALYRAKSAGRNRVEQA
jgi:diguanylate cyclase (GGDEF)-like protein